MNAPDRAAFLARRKEGIGGSDMAAILGMSKYTTPLQVWMEKTGRAAPQAETLQMRFGIFAEEFVAQEYQRDTGRRVQRFNGLLRHQVAPIIGNVDRLVIPEGAKVAAHKGEIRTDRGWEGKTASAFAAGDEEWGDSGTDEVPPYYLIQVQTYQELTGCQYWDLSVLFGNQEVRHYTIQRDKELGEELARRAAEWWEKHVVADVRPDPVNEDDIKLLFPKDSGRIIEANPKTLELLGRAQELKARIKELELELDGDSKKGIHGVMGALKVFMGDASAITLGGQELATWKAAKPSTKTDWQALFTWLSQSVITEKPELAPQIDAAVADKTAIVPGSRRFLIK